MGIAGIRVPGRSDGHRRILVRNVGNAQRGLVGPEADFAAPVLGIGASVDNAHGVVGVAGLVEPGRAVRETSDKLRAGRIANVDHVESAAAVLAPAVAAHRVGEPGLFVDHDVVDTRDVVVVRRRREGHGRTAQLAQLREVEDLHPVRSGSVGDDERMIPVHLDIAPHAGHGPVGHRQRSRIQRLCRVLQSDERGSTGMAHQRPFGTGDGIRPSPQVAHQRQSVELVHFQL